jgi:hypothetical protein
MDSELWGQYYHFVIFHFLFGNKYNALLNLDPPLKNTMPLGAKTTRADSTLEMAPPPLFLDRFLDPGQLIFCTI